MIKAYKVIEGYKVDFYGYPTNEEIAKYFFNKADAEAEYKKGEFTTDETVIYTAFKNDKVKKATTGVQFYEETKKRARENEKVVIEKVTYNKYRMEEIEIN